MLSQWQEVYATISKLNLNSFEVEMETFLLNVSMSKYFILISVHVHSAEPLSWTTVPSNKSRVPLMYIQLQKKKKIHQVSRTDMQLPAPRSFGGELFDHNFSRMDSPEIKSASWTASRGANIPVHFFIDLHSFPPSPCNPPPHPKTQPTPTPRCLLCSLPVASVAQNSSDLQGCV